MDRMSDILFTSQLLFFVIVTRFPQMLAHVLHQRQDVYMQPWSVMHADSLPAGSVSECGASDTESICLLGDLGPSWSLEAPNM